MWSGEVPYAVEGMPAPIQEATGVGPPTEAYFEGETDLIGPLPWLSGWITYSTAICRASSGLRDLGASVALASSLGYTLSLAPLSYLACQTQIAMALLESATRIKRYV